MYYSRAKMSNDIKSELGHLMNYLSTPDIRDILSEWLQQIKSRSDKLSLTANQHLQSRTRPYEFDKKLYHPLRISDEESGFTKMDRRPIKTLY